MANFDIYEVVWYIIHMILKSMYNIYKADAKARHVNGSNNHMYVDQMPNAYEMLMMKRTEALKVLPS